MVATCGFDSAGVARVAAPGFACRVDAPNGLWGFCPSTVISASDCGFGGYCIDLYECSDGCGPLQDRPDITTYTCPVDNYCSTLISDNNFGSSYIGVGCGAKAARDVIFASPPSISATTSLRTSTSTTSFLEASLSIESVAPSTTPESESTTVDLQSQSTITERQSQSTITESESQSATTNPQTESTTTEQQSKSSSTPPTTLITSATSSPSSSLPTSSSAAAAEETPNAAPTNSTPLGPIIGGAVGGIAVVCLTVLAIFYIRHRNRRPHSRRSTPPPLERSPSCDKRMVPDDEFRRYELDDQRYFEASEANNDPSELPGHEVYKQRNG